jgi:hypothetical protein
MNTTMDINAERVPATRVKRINHSLAERMVAGLLLKMTCGGLRAHYADDRLEAHDGVLVGQ